MKSLVSLLAAFCILLVGPLRAQDVAPPNPVVVELFTSQGCASCPPADAMIAELAAREDVIALALHVDYWDYIGWVDEYANPAHTRRQKAYARIAGRNMIYTPQIIVNGLDEIEGARPMKLADRIMAQHQRPAVIKMTAARDGQKMQVKARAVGTLPDGMLIIQLVRYSPLQHARITDGENAGRNLDYANVVKAWDVLAKWDGVAPLDLTADLPGDAAAAVLIQQEGPGAIVAAARVR
ncbi:DUF1223 domain-containing protein [Pontibaca salina]|uniref:DUF1223 domain-containing protein n=1 Tax=Pontibaca salina TaxID=2795731 RepID=A0A934HRY5_9RHOB|nr:DUF1223 domain-containing protein [Pontibaca salina]MBI6629108.1 DUF1223 domain-containing protein [Pontibaca salina]